jgi:hypothetical protein
MKEKEMTVYRNYTYMIIIFIWLHISTTGPGAHPASCTMGTGYFPGVKRPGRGADHPPLAPRSRMSRAIPLLPLWALRGLL